MSDQKDMWNRKHAAGEHDKWDGQPRWLAEHIVNDLEAGSTMLELGCGTGSDARYFAAKGVHVTATDFSEVAIQQNQSRANPPNLAFQVLDMTTDFPYDDATFDIVYAYLSLHYYDDHQTKRIFKEIARVLKPDGRLYFSCKSVNDPKYGEGEMVGEDIFRRHGHLRHFFSPDYAQEVIAEAYELLWLEERNVELYEERSAVLDCGARKATKL